jgi:thiol:disulfide interchange protein DsbD
VKVDITDESDNQAMLRNAQGVIGPPSFLFFDANGNENKSLRIVGEASAETFLTALRAGNP